MGWKLLVALLLIAAHLPLHAEWIRVSASQRSVFYLDSDKSAKVGDNVMIWVLRDHRHMQVENNLVIRSSRDQIEVDCAGRRIRRIFTSDHARRMGEGPMVHSEHGPMSWNAATPNTPVSRIIEITCALT